MSDSTIVADGLNEACHQLNRLKKLYRDLNASAGQLDIAHNKLQHLEGPLQNLGAAIPAKDLLRIKEAYDWLREVHSEVLRFFFEQNRDIRAKCQALAQALDQAEIQGPAQIAAENLLSTHELAAAVTRDGITPGEWEALAIGVALAKNPPGTKLKFRTHSVSISAGKAVAA
jgi:hypothetical protein